eukprot:TRINITY_DN11333_c0_g1_i3.p1 TRINITY_DN11333_c0_g1~~TRINITY_DN11333_c0_g1_i3.p1  ORF type:complete len:523 (+),score=88.88 TRINITY_DN11333_c0_g1_i3:102-1571(+)
MMADADDCAAVGPQPGAADSAGFQQVPLPPDDSPPPAAAAASSPPRHSQPQWGPGSPTAPQPDGGGSPTDSPRAAHADPAAGSGTPDGGSRSDGSDGIVDSEGNDVNAPYDAATLGSAAEAERWPSAFGWLPQHVRRRASSQALLWQHSNCLGVLQSEAVYSAAGRSAPSPAAEDEVGFAPRCYLAPAPLPLSPAGDARPDEAFLADLQRREEAMAQAEAEERRATEAQRRRHAEAAAAGQQVPVGTRVNAWLWHQGSRLDRSIARAHLGTERRVRDMLSARHAKLFAQRFPSLAQRLDNLVAAYSCKVFSSGATVCGDLYLTEGHLCFAATWAGNALLPTAKEKASGLLGSFSAAATAPAGAPPVRFFIQWRDVLSVRPAICLATADPLRPFVLPLPDPRVPPDVLQIFTRAGTVVELTGFGGLATSAAEKVTGSVQGDALGRCYRFIDSLWRARCTVPDPDYDWASAAGVGGGGGTGAPGHADTYDV